MKKKYRIRFERKGCIGAGPCTTFSDNWEVDPMKDGKATFKGEGEGKEYLTAEITEEELEREIEAAKSCPVNVIHIEEVETGKKII